MKKISRKKSLLAGFVAAFVLIAIWLVSQGSETKTGAAPAAGNTAEYTAEVYDPKTGKFYSPAEMRKLAAERGAE